MPEAETGDLTANFDRSEFRCKCGCGADHVDLRLVQKLQRLRSFLREPIKVTSGVRCPEYNKSVGGKPDSSHLTGEAADIACPSSRLRYRMKRTIYTWALFNRIGNGRNFLHVDVSELLPQEVEWEYP